MDASFYVDVGTAYQGQTVTFAGTVLSNTFVAPYTCVAVIKEFTTSYGFIGQTTATLTAGQPFTISRTIGTGSVTQYGFVTDGPDASPIGYNALGRVVVAVNTADPNLATVSNQSAVEGQKATFNAKASGTAPITYQWYSLLSGVTNTLANSSHFSGVTTSNLTISNIVVADAGTYFVKVTNPKTNVIGTATLLVNPLATAQTNMLLDPGFEDAAISGDSTAGWAAFNGTYQANTNVDFYNLSADPVISYEGSNVFQIYSGGEYNGVFQDRPATPGQLYTANGEFRVATDDPIANTNVCYLEVQFRNGAAVLVDYRSVYITTSTPLDTWIKLSPTNIYSGDFTTLLGTSPYMVAPAGTTTVRWQVTYHALPGGSGSVYVDNAVLKLSEPTTTVLSTNNTVKISFPTLYGPSYKVLYKTNLTSATWSTLTTVTGDGTTKTVSDTIGNGSRYYIVNTQ
jgi:hypothetical protein